MNNTEAERIARDHLTHLLDFKPCQTPPAGVYLAVPATEFFFFQSKTMIGVGCGGGLLLAVSKSTGRCVNLGTFGE